MSAATLAAFDCVISDSARLFLESLTASELEEFDKALESILRDPHPDGQSKVHLSSFPYQPGTIGATSGDFWIVYRFPNAATLGIATVYWNPSSPRRTGELYEG